MTTSTFEERYAAECRTLGRTYRLVRHAVGLHQRELAPRLGISHSTLSKYERGSTAQPLDFRHRFARVAADIILERRAATR